MSFGQIYILLRARLGLILACTALVLAAAMAVRLLLPPSFKSVVSIVVDTRGINPVSGASTQDGMEQEAVLGTAANVARSEGVARDVVSEVGIDRQGSTIDRWRADTGGVGRVDVWAARQLAKSIDVRPGGQNSHVLDISVVAPTRDESALLANAFAAATIAKLREMRVAPARENALYLERQASVLRASAVQAEALLAQFQRTHGVTSSDEKADADQARLAALNSELAQNQTKAYDGVSRSQQAQRGSNSPDLMTSPLVQALSADVLQQEAAVTDAAQRLGANHPDLIKAQSKLAQARAALARETGRSRETLKIESAVGNQRLASLQVDSAAQQRKVVEMSALRVELTALSRDAAQKRKLYELAEQRSAESGLNALSEHDDVKVLNLAEPPDRANGPPLKVTLLVALLAGLGLGSLAALLLERMTPRLHSISDFEALDIHVVATVLVGARGARAPLLSWSRT